MRPIMKGYLGFGFNKPGRGGGTRTHIPKRRILSPLRLPIPPRPHMHIVPQVVQGFPTTCNDHATQVGLLAPRGKQDDALQDVTFAGGIFGKAAGTHDLEQA